MNTLALVWLYAGMNIGPIYAPSRTLTDQFASIIGGLLHALSVTRHENRLWGPLLMVVYARMGRAQKLLGGLAERIGNGWRPAVARARAPRAVADRPAVSAPPAVVVPRQFGWVVQMAPHVHLVNPWRFQLEDMLVNNPEMALVVAGVPQMGRELRPLCHMLAIKVPDWLKLPKRKRKPRPDPAIPVPGETPEQADRRVARMSEKAFINLLTPECEFLKWRPPHSVGYGRSGIRIKRS